MPYCILIYFNKLNYYYIYIEGDGGVSQSSACLSQDTGQKLYNGIPEPGS